jgi:16S rRNA (cytidine1402-2'-O)-methyltransferase
LQQTRGRVTLAHMTDDQTGPTADPAQRAGRIETRRIVEHALAELETQLARPLAPGLHLVATPIGNLGDITVRALAVLANADRLYCEDTRQSQKLLLRFGIARRLDIYHEHNAERERPRILAALADGRSVALISDAGTPLVSDPGYKLVRDAVEAGHAVHAVPGASAVLAALAGAGLPTDAFHFAGFLPPRTTARRERIGLLQRVPATLVLFEAPSRLAETLEDLAGLLGPRQAMVGRELTKLNEELRRGTLSELAAWARGGPFKGEIAIVIGPGPEEQSSDEQIVAALEPELRTLSLRDAAHAVATRLGVSRKRVYDLALKVRDGPAPQSSEDDTG